MLRTWIRWTICKLFHRGVYIDIETRDIEVNCSKTSPKVRATRTHIAFCCKQCGRTWES